MSDLPPKVAKAPGYTATAHDSVAPRTMDVRVGQPDGSVLMVPCVTAAGSSFSVCMPQGGPSFGAFALCASGPGGPIGMFAPMDAQVLREMSASLLSAANLLDNGKGKQ